LKWWEIPVMLACLHSPMDLHGQDNKLDRNPIVLQIHDESLPK